MSPIPHVTDTLPSPAKSICFTFLVKLLQKKSPITNWFLEWMDFGPLLLWDCNETWPFPALWLLLSYLISCVTWFPCLIDNEDHILFCELLWDSMSSSALLLLLPLFSFFKGFSAGLLGCFYPFFSLCFMSNCIPVYFLIN